MSTERLRQHLAEKRTAYGLWVTSESPSIVEVAAALGLDWVCIDMEHGYLDLKNIATHLLAAKGSDLTVLVRPPTHDLDPIKRAIDLGAHGIILPLVETADEVRTALSHLRYPPEGTRGIGGERNATWGLALEEYIRTANSSIMFIPMIETRLAAENYDEILSVDGVDAVFLGPGDMSASYGFIGEWEGPGIAELNLDLLARAEARGIRTGIVARSTDEVVSRTAEGFGMVSIGSDTGLMIRQAREIATAIGRTPVGHRWF